MKGRNTSPQTHSKAIWFVSAILLFILCCAIGVTTLSLQSSEQNFKQDIERRMELQAQSNAGELMAWYEALQTQIGHLADSDVFRLFASEINAQGKQLTEILRLAGNDTDLGERTDEQAQLAAQIPLMRNLLREFVTLSNFQSARIVTDQLHPYLVTGEKGDLLPPEQQQLASLVFSSGQSKTLSLHQNNNELFLDIAFPIFAPSYVDRPGEHPVSVLLISLNVTDKLKGILSTESRFHDAGTTRILQKSGNVFQMILPGAENKIITLPGWTAIFPEHIPLEIRSIPGEDSPCFFLGLRAKQLPLYIVQILPVHEGMAAFRAYRSNLILLVSISTGILFSLIGMIWWWLVGRRERAVSQELNELYQTVNEQKQLLDGINNSLPAGIVLTNDRGFIRYANPAFATMTGRQPSSLPGLDAEALFGYSTAQRITRHQTEVLENGTSVTFTDVVWLRSQKYHFNISCSPFREQDKAISGVVSVYRDITELVEAQERSQATVQQTITVLVNTIEAVDPYLRGQGALTGQLAAALVRHLGLSETDEATVKTAANLFQIGMLRIPTALLTKSGPLTPEERAQLEKHVDYTHEALAGIDFGLPVLEAITQMYERLDGSGYPGHLQGEAITVHARVLAIANTFCAMLRPRSYRQAKTIEQALDILELKPPKYDLDIVKALREYLGTPNGEKFLLSLQGK